MKKPNLNKLLAKYKKKLRLQDWDITVRYGTQKEMGTRVGQTSYDWRNNYATIMLLEPKDNPNTSHWLTNVELTLVHELVHILLSPLTNPEDSKWQDAFNEQCIEKLARAIVGI